jgi:predicted ATP-grasp superfamily ATP-dependent carboligase
MVGSDQAGRAMNARVLVLDANQRSALAITRSLGRHAGITVLTADTTPRALAGVSRFSSGYRQYPSPAHDPVAFIAWLAATVDLEAITHLFPATEVSSYTCLMHRERLGACKLPFAALETVQRLADKCRLMALAEELGIPHPPSLRIEDSRSVDLDQIGPYPVVLKPCYSQIWQGRAWLSSSVHVAHSAEEFRQLTGTLPYLRDHPFLVQDFIPGAGAGVFALYREGTAVNFFAHRRLREKPPSGGVSVLSESTSLDPRMLELSRRLLDRARWHGVAMVEFRVTPAGEPSLMEVNPRFWGSLQLAIDCGIDFPHLLFEHSEGRDACAPADYPTGRRLRWLLGDLDSLYLYLRDGHCHSKRDKLARVLAFLQPHLASTRHEVNRFGDLGPARFELVQYFRDMAR